VPLLGAGLMESTAGGVSVNGPLVPAGRRL